MLEKKKKPNAEDHECAAYSPHWSTAEVEIKTQPVSVFLSFLFQTRVGGLVGRRQSEQRQNRTERVKKERLPSCFCLVKNCLGWVKGLFLSYLFWQSYCISHRSDEIYTVKAKLSQPILVVFSPSRLCFQPFTEIRIAIYLCLFPHVPHASWTFIHYPQPLILCRAAANSSWHPDPKAEYCKAQKANSEFGRYFDFLVNRLCALCGGGGEILIRREKSSLIDFQAQLSLF